MDENFAETGASAKIDDLHRTYLAGKLRVLVGAGISVGSHFPSWNELNSALLRLAVRYDHPDIDRTIDGDKMARLLGELAGQIGFTGIADLVYTRLGEERFNRALSDCLYTPPSNTNGRKRRITELAVTSVQRQIAALAIDFQDATESSRINWKKSGERVADIYTLNYDPLIEIALALAEHKGVFRSRSLNLETEFRKFRDPAGAHDNNGKNLPVVRHLHGWVDPDGAVAGPIVLREKQHHELSDFGDARVSGLLNEPGATLILGMSLSDPLWRRLLYQRADNGLRNQDAKVFAIVRQTDALAIEYVTRFWASLRVEILTVAEYDQIAGILRQIQWGVPNPDADPGWIDESMKETRVVAAMLRDRAWSTTARAFAKILQSEVQRSFAHPHEKVGVSFFLPVDTGERVYLAEVWKVDADGKGPTGSAADHAREHRFSIRTGQPEGMAGVSFVEGWRLEAIDFRGEYFDHNFDRRPELQQNFKPGVWRSLLALPQVGGPLHVPLGVVCITSDFCKDDALPFWRRTDIDQSAFTQTIEATFFDLVHFWSSH